jgi:hypothetical protein
VEINVINYSAKKIADILDVDPVFPKIRKKKKRLIMRRMVHKFEQTIKVCSKAAHSSRYFLAL